MARGMLLVFAALLAIGAAMTLEQPRGPNHPINKILTLLTDMKAQVEKEAKADEVGYEKYMCWCDKNRQEKTEAIEIATKEIDRLTAFLEEAAAKEAQLKTEIEQLTADIAEDKEALSTATALRNDEKTKYMAVEADYKESRALLKEAIEVLSKVQTEGLVQTNHARVKKAQVALVQVRNIVSRRFPKFQSVMQRDLFDMLGSLEDATQSKEMLAGAFMSDADRAKQADVFQQQHGAGRLLPWEKTEEQIGQEKKPNELQGAAAGALSYNARSGRILGILQEMHDEFTRDLAKATYEEYLALVAYQKLAAAKTEEIYIASETKKRKEATLAELLDAIAKAKEDKAAMEDALAADQAFLAEMEKSCKAEEGAYAERRDSRAEEIRALSEALKILTEDEARATFDRSFSLIQEKQSRRAAAEAEMVQDRRSERAMKRLAEVANRQKNWALVSLAIRTRLDSFTKVIDMMDRMAAELATQQKKEYEKWEFCKSEIDKTEDTIKMKEQVKKELAEKHQELVNKIDTLSKDIASLRNEVSNNEVALKDAGEDRKEENRLYQASVMDQRATVKILEKALARLQDFYGFLQTGQPVTYNPIEKPDAPVPGAKVAPPPPTGAAYQKHKGGEGVLGVIKMVIADATRTEQALDADEQAAQKRYSSLVNDLTASIEADRAAIEEKEQQLADAEVEKSETEEAQLANEEELKNLAELLHHYHLDCDFLLKYFDIRQRARQEEMDAIADAKAILSGADFGK